MSTLRTRINGELIEMTDHKSLYSIEGCTHYTTHVDNIDDEDSSTVSRDWCPDNNFECAIRRTQAILEMIDYPHTNVSFVPTVKILEIEDWFRGRKGGWL